MSSIEASGFIEKRSHARSVAVGIDYSSNAIKKKIMQDMKSFSYSDVASGSSDSITIELTDKEKKWISNYYPAKGNKITAHLTFQSWYEQYANINLICGSFYIDEISYDSPGQFTIGASALKQDSKFNKKERTKTWKKLSLYAIAKKIADTYKMKLVYSAGTINIAKIEQTNQTDCKFLFDACQTYGMSMKVFSDKIIIFDSEKKEKEKAKVTIKATHILDISYNDTMTGIYTGVEVTYTNPDDDKEYTVKAGSGNSILKVDVSADNKKDAELKGLAKLNEENKKEKTLQLSIIPNPRIYAGININLSGFHKLDGKYYVERVTTRVSGGTATSMNLALHKIQSRIKTKSASKSEEKKAAASNASSTTYTVKTGDTIWNLAIKFYGKGKYYTKIYNANKNIIESTAKSRGLKSSDGGHWIFAGTKLTIVK